MSFELFTPNSVEASVEAKRNSLGAKAMRLVSEGLVDKALQKRAEWIAESLNIKKYLEPKIKFADKLAGKVEQGVSVLSVGSGKGHEMDELDQLLPGSKIRGLDPNDYTTRPVRKRLDKLAHDAKYLSEDVSAENLKGIDSGSMDGVLFSFVLHHIDTEKYDKVMSELNRVLKDDGYVFIAEDLVDPSSEKEKKTTEKMDRLWNMELSGQAPHNYQDLDKWEKFFEKSGFEVVEANEQKPAKVRHGFMVLKKKIEK